MGDRADGEVGFVQRQPDVTHVDLARAQQGRRVDRVDVAMQDADRRMPALEAAADAAAIPDGSRGPFEEQGADLAPLLVKGASTGIAVEVWALRAEPLRGRVEGLVRATILDVLDGLAADASVRCVSVTLTVNARGLRLTVTADGTGPPTARLADRLRVRRAGFAKLGGGLSTNAVPGGGLTVSAALPARGSGAAGR